MFDAEPVPNQEVILNRMGGDNYIYRLDGFCQVPIKEEDRKYTAFSTDDGLMQFKEEMKQRLAHLGVCYYYISIHNNREIYVQSA